MRRIDINDPSQLPLLTELIHDEAFEAQEIQFDSQLCLAVIPIARIFHGAPDKIVRRTILYEKREVDVLRAIIRISHVNAATIKDTEGIGTYTFDTVRFDIPRSELVFTTMQPFLLRFSVSRIQIQYEDLKFAGKAYITRSLFWVKSSFAHPAGAAACL